MQTAETAWTLGRWLRGHRPSWAEAVQITAALADVHSRPIIHRDIKPAMEAFSGDRPIA